ncbi:MAG: proline--tRNA ligase [Candidatus Nanohaloarchaeota archaeon QJJ-9]|nr:proline--tRNA ligase [Candidatus Nanohaloarchaeota archaeon QJJ-9]
MTKDQELGITVDKEKNVSEWFTQAVTKAELAEYAPMKGFMIIEPYGMKIWENIKENFNEMIEDEVDNASFPSLIPESLLEKEKDIVEGFDPEVAWVTEAGKDGELEEKLAVRPTSESMIAPYMSKKIRSYRDLPFRVNQWCNIVRWEATDTRPFLRTREFLWQEGHTAHRNNEKAHKEVMKRLNQYEKLYEEFLAIPVLKGKKPEHDKFPGAEVTMTVEALMPSGRSIQSGTSHNLGQQFAKAFDIEYEDENQENNYCYTCSWGLSTRSIGPLALAHGDSQGLVLPPRIAPIQAVIVPIFQEESKEEVLDYCRELEDELKGIRTEIDREDHRSPGYKFNKWELKGVPLRIEIGPNEAEDREVTLVRRDNRDKKIVKLEEAGQKVEGTLEEIHEDLYQNLLDYRDKHIHEAVSYEEILEKIEEEKGYVKAPWCGREECEAEVKDEIHAEIVMVPLEDEELEGENCAICGNKAIKNAYFAKTY